MSVHDRTLVLANSGTTATVLETCKLGTAIPDPTITNRLDGLYSGTTYGLLTGIAEAEGSYAQFYGETLMGAYGKWPHGNAGTQHTAPDSFVGLMQVPNSMASGFDWYTNTTTGENTFSDKLSSARTYVANEQSEYPNLPALTQAQLENVALVYYNGIQGVEYYVPNSGGSGWVTTTNQTALTYVSNVRNGIQ
ncbi:MAG: hypothetical protein ACRD2O_04310 [Terriglobia bacterium]